MEQEKVKLQIMKAKLLHVYQGLRPCHAYPVTIRRDGSHWMCIMESAEDITDCPVAYGGSPAQALANFDALWNGAGIEIDPGEEEEEEKF